MKVPPAGLAGVGSQDMILESHFLDEIKRPIPSVDTETCLLIPQTFMGG